MTRLYFKLLSDIFWSQIFVMKKKYFEGVSSTIPSKTRRRIALGLVASRKFRRTRDMLGRAVGGDYRPQTIDGDGEDIRLTEARDREGLSLSRCDVDIGRDCYASDNLTVNFCL